MTDEQRQILQRIIDFCNGKWIEADREPSTHYDEPGTQTGRKMAYNDVLQFARRMQSSEKG